VHSEEVQGLRVGVTGCDGLIGRHVRCRLHAEPGFEAVHIDRPSFTCPQTLLGLVAGCDAVIHLAGMNRGDDDEIERENPAIARSLVNAMETANVTPHVVFSSSTHVDKETAYGRSKRNAGHILADWATCTGARFTNLVLPHVFGEAGRPFYNSVVSTFCYQIAHGETPAIDHDGELELLHAQDVAELCVDILRSRSSGEIRPRGQEMRVSDLLEQVMRMAQRYGENVIPDFASSLDLRLFNTYRSYLFPDSYPRSLKLNSDQRGALFEAVKTDHGGQAFLSTTHPGVTRGDHFHFHKVERFLVLQGQAVIRVRHVLDDHVTEFYVDGREPVFIDMPTLHIHSIKNIGDGELLTLFWAHEILDPDNPDTYRDPVLRGEDYE